MVESLRSALDFVDIVGQASGVEEAVAWIPLARPHVVLLDLAMQDGNGLEVLGELQSLSPTPAVVVVTNNPSPMARKRCLDAGARDFLDKSREFNKLSQVLTRLADELALPQAPSAELPKERGHPEPRGDEGSALSSTRSTN